MTERVNILPRAKEIRTGELAVALPDSLDPDDLKVERAALFAVVIDTIMGKALGLKDEAPPYGLITEEGNIRTTPPSDLWTFKEEMDSQLVLATLEAFRTKDSREAAILKRLEKVNTSFGSTKSVGTIINDGLVTSQRTMFGLLSRTWEESVRREIPFDKFERFARRSAAVILQIASMNIVDFDENNSERNFPWDNLRVDENGQGPAFRLVNEGLLKNPVEITTGCPALINFGRRSAIVGLWDWHVYIATEMYRLGRVQSA